MSRLTRGLIKASPSRPVPWLITDAPCPGQFYAFGAPYPDGTCHDGHLDDADGDGCTIDFDYRPCPYCENAAYLERLADDGHFTPPYGYNLVHPGDFFALPFAAATGAEGEEQAQ